MMITTGSLTIARLLKIARKPLGATCIPVVQYGSGILWGLPHLY